MLIKRLGCRSKHSAKATYLQGIFQKIHHYWVLNIYKVILFWYPVGNELCQENLIYLIHNSPGKNVINPVEKVPKESYVYCAMYISAMVGKVTSFVNG